MSSVPGSQRFLLVTSSLGVVDVRSIDTRCILVLTAPETDDEKLDAIRVLALAAWPQITIMIGRRASIRETGTHRIGGVDRESELPREWQEDLTA